MKLYTYHKMSYICRNYHGIPNRVYNKKSNLKFSNQLLQYAGCAEVCHHETVSAITFFMDKLIYIVCII